MIPFVGPSHPLSLDRVDLQRSINLYPVRAEDAGEKTESHLAPVPGLTLWSAQPPATWQPVLRNGVFRYSLVDDFDIADPEFNEASLPRDQGTFGDVNPHPFNGVAWPVNTLTPPPTTGDVLWVRKTSRLEDFVSTWHVNIVHDNTLRAWFNGVEVFPAFAEEYRSTIDVTPILGDNVFVIRVVETLPGAPTNHSQAGFEITR
jgi:hypothetical protein